MNKFLKPEANARLIASAPALLSALEALVDVQDVEDHDSPENQLSEPHDVEDCALCTARAVIAKVKA